MRSFSSTFIFLIPLTGVLTHVTVDCAIFSGILDVIDSLPLSCVETRDEQCYKIIFSKDYYLYLF